MPLFKTLCLSICFLVCAQAQAQVCEGDFSLRTQAEVEDWNCTEVNGSLTIGSPEENDITDLSPLAVLQSISGFLNVVDCDSLTHLSGLEGLETLGEFLSIFRNPELVSLTGLGGLESVAGTVVIEENAVLLSLSGLENLTTIGIALQITGNAMLASLTGLEGLESIGKDLRIEKNPSLESLSGLEALSSVDESVEVLYNDSLTSLSGLQGLASVGDGLLIGENNALISLSGVENITLVGGDLEVTYNDALDRCSCGLSGLITGDPAAFSGVEGDVHISGNDPEGTCTSPEVVLDTPCEPVANELDSAAPQELTLEVYPNPVARVATLQYALPEAGLVRLAVYDLLGREVAVLAAGVQPVGRHEAQLDGLATGTYVVRIEVGDGEEVLTRRVTVVN